MPNPIHPKNAEARDWHPAEIVAALWKKGLSMRQLALANGLDANTLNQANQVIYPNAEQIIATALGHHPKEIWPSRYDENGLSLARPMGRPRKGDTIRPAQRRHVRVWRAK